MKLSNFDRAVILAVDRRYPEYPDRVRELVRARGIEPKVFLNGRGVEGTDLADYRLVHTGEAPEGWGSTRAAWDYSRTFRAVVAEALEDGLDSLLILEDDVDLTADFDAVVDRAEVPDDWQLLYYGAWHCWGGTTPVNDLVLRVNGAVGTQCVGLRRRAMEAILDLPMKTTADSEIANLIHETMPCYALYPSVARQRIGVTSYVIPGEPFWADFLYDSKGAVSPVDRE